MEHGRTQWWEKYKREEQVESERRNVYWKMKRDRNKRRRENERKQADEERYDKKVYE